MALRSVGVQVVAVEESGDLRRTLDEYASQPDVGLIIVSEALAADRQALLAEARRDSDTVILVVPSYRGAKGSTLAFMKHTLEQSIGVDLISRS